MDTNVYGLPLKKRSWVKVAIILTVLVVVGVSAGVAMGWFLTQQSQKLPGHITDQLKFSPHLPAQVPPGYTLQTSEAQFDKGVLLVYLKNTASHQIVFTEQARPTNQNFDNFYMQNLANSERLENVKYESVLGDLPSGGYMLGILTDSTWLLISTSAPNGKAALKYIAQHIL